MLQPNQRMFAQGWSDDDAIEELQKTLQTPSGMKEDDAARSEDGLKAPSNIETRR